MPADLQAVDQVRVLVDFAALWAIHAGRIAVWVLLASASLLLLLRIGLLLSLPHAARARLGSGWQPGRFARWAAAAAALGAVSLYEARRPDAGFLIGRGQAALAAGRHQEALGYLEPVARWGSDRPELYDGLAVCYLKLGRVREALDALGAAEQRAPGRPERHVVWAYTLLLAGQPGSAAAQFEKAARLARSQQQRAGIEKERERLLGSFPGVERRP